MAKVKVSQLVTDFAIKNDEIEVEKDSTIREIIEILNSKYQKFKEYLIDPKTGDLQYGILVALNQKDVRSLKGLDTAVHEGDTISFYPPISGG
jgi:molybdopterin synthase sulfur carrier subunit